MAQNVDLPISCKNFSVVTPPNPRPVLGDRAVLFPDSCCFGSHNFQIVPARLVIQWLVGAWAEVYIAQCCRWKGGSLNCPETRRREVEDSQQSRRWRRARLARRCLTKTSTERTTESRQSYRRLGGEVSCDSEEVQLSRRLTDGFEAGLHQLATDCVRVFRYSFVAFNLVESVSLCILFWVI